MTRHTPGLGHAPTPAAIRADLAAAGHPGYQVAAVTPATVRVRCPGPEIGDELAVIARLLRTAGCWTVDELDGWLLVSAGTTP